MKASPLSNQRAAAESLHVLPTSQPGLRAGMWGRLDAHYIMRCRLDLNLTPTAGSWQGFA